VNPFPVKLNMPQLCRSCQRNLKLLHNKRAMKKLKILAKTNEESQEYQSGNGPYT